MWTNMSTNPQACMEKHCVYLPSQVWKKFYKTSLKLKELM